MIFQNPAASLNESATVELVISLSVHNYHLFKDEEDRKEKVQKMIHEVGLLKNMTVIHEFLVVNASVSGLPVLWWNLISLWMSQFRPWTYRYVRKS